MTTDYQSRLLAHIANFRRYPQEAEADRLTGNVAVGFMVGPNGQVLDAWVEQSSGRRILDEEAVRTILRAQPLPLIPRSDVPTRLSLVLAFNDPVRGDSMRPAGL